MAQPSLRLGCCLALLLGPALLAQAPGALQVKARLASMQAVMDRFFRGESLEAGHKRVNAQVEAFNAQVAETTRQTDAARAQAEREIEPGRALGTRLEAMDKSLGSPPDPADRAGVRSYNARVDARNTLAGQYNEFQAKAKGAVDACNALTRRLDTALEASRTQVNAEQEALKARQDAFEAFRAADRDVAFFTQVNRFLADLRAADRAQGDPELPAALAKVRACRRELAAWAEARQAAQPNGLVLVRALVGDEACCFIVDTGAQQVCLPTELIGAVGLAGNLGAETTMILAGGQKVRGRSITLPMVAASGMAASDVAASAIPPSEVGIDGLLGQTFLKHFVYTIDERRQEKLVLTAR